MNEIEIKGGARVGSTHCSFPLATLKVDKDRLILKVAFIGTLIFRATDIISIEPYIVIPLIGQGIKITHTVTNYKKRVIFWTFKNPQSVIRQIESTGFIGEKDFFV
ncbi:MAG: hypothetical protein Sapg2KO_18600 [Saprospiraceae bacterium]